MKELDVELEELREEIKKIIGEEALERILKIVELSYTLDEEPTYKLTHTTIE